MKYVATIVFVFTVLMVSGQQDTARIRQQARDSVNRILQSELGISRGKADTVLAIISASIAKMKTVHLEKGLTGPQRMDRFRELAKERDDQLAKQLTPAQIQQLQVIVMRIRQSGGVKKD
jgi:hypothetical protein